MPENKSPCENKLVSIRTSRGEHILKCADCSGRDPIPSMKRSSPAHPSMAPSPPPPRAMDWASGDVGIDGIGHFPGQSAVLRVHSFCFVRVGQHRADIEIFLAWHRSLRYAHTYRSLPNVINAARFCSGDDHGYPINRKTFWLSLVAR